MWWWVSFKNSPQYNYSYINFSNRLSKTHTHRHADTASVPPWDTTSIWNVHVHTHTQTHTICFHDNRFHGNRWADHVPTVPEWGDCLRHVPKWSSFVWQFSHTNYYMGCGGESAPYYFLWLTIFSCISDYSSWILLLIKSKRFGTYASAFFSAKHAARWGGGA